MKKVILNTCFGGYGWSKHGVVEVLKRKGFNELHYFLGSQWDKEPREVDSGRFFDDDGWGWFIRVIPGIPYEDAKGGSDEEFDEAYETVYSGNGFNRDDQDAVWVLENRGSEFCSDGSSRLEVREFDDDLFRFGIDEYDGAESLDLTPNITEDRILACGTLEAVVELLKATRVICPDLKEEVFS